MDLRTLQTCCLNRHALRASFASYPMICVDYKAFTIVWVPWALKKLKSFLFPTSQSGITTVCKQKKKKKEKIFILYFCKSYSSYYYYFNLKCSCTDRERLSICRFTPRMAPQLKLCQYRVRTQKLLPGVPCTCSGPSSQAAGASSIAFSGYL